MGGSYTQSSPNQLANNTYALCFHRVSARLDFLLGVINDQSDFPPTFLIFVHYQTVLTCLLVGVFVSMTKVSSYITLYHVSDLANEG